MLFCVGLNAAKRSRRTKLTIFIIFCFVKVIFLFPTMMDKLTVTFCFYFYVIRRIWRIFYSELTIIVIMSMSDGWWFFCRIVNAYSLFLFFIRSVGRILPDFYTPINSQKCPHSHFMQCPLRWLQVVQQIDNKSNWVELGLGLIIVPWCEICATDERASSDCRSTSAHDPPQNRIHSNSNQQIGCWQRPE